MARNPSNIGVLNDLEVGLGNYVHSDITWNGGDGTGTDGPDFIRYQPGDLVVSAGILYVCLLSNVNLDPASNSASWQPISAGMTTGGGGGGTGNGFTLVDTLPSGTLGDHARTNGDGRGYVRYANAWTQVDGQTSIQIVNPQMQTNDIDTSPVMDNQWELIPTYFTGGGSYD